MVVFLLVLGIERQLGIGFGFFSTAWGLLITILITRLIGSRISHERPLTAVAAMATRELVTPRETKNAAGGAASAARIRVQRNRPRPGQRRCRRFGRAGKDRAGKVRAGKDKVRAGKEERGVRARTSAQTGTTSGE